MTDSNDKTREEILLARRMFFAGCLGLPWLWICNALYFRLRVFGPLVMVDYWPGKSPESLPPSAAGGREWGGESDVNGNDSGVGVSEQRMLEEQLEREMEGKELEKWVKRSTSGAFAVVTLFVAWIVTFQVNKEHFGPKWFVMDQTDAETSGW
jgi:hypothetical protein